MLHCVRLLQARIATALVAATIAILAGEAAADTSRIGRPSARGFAGVPLVTGVKHGFFRARGLDLEQAVSASFLPRDRDADFWTKATLDQ
jgi:ABC-type nitrate/sulfonate/bicarbonate transport system substrate-binding protein